MDEGDTVLIERSIKNAARVADTSYSRKVLEMEAKGATLEELLPVLDGNLIKKLYASGDTEVSLVYCGQSAGLIKDIPTVKEIIDNIMSEASEVIEKLKAMTARGDTDHHVNVLTKARMEDFASRAGFRLTRTLDDLLEKDIVYILHKK